MNETELASFSGLSKNVILKFFSNFSNLDK